MTVLRWAMSSVVSGLFVGLVAGCGAGSGDDDDDATDPDVDAGVDGGEDECADVDGDGWGVGRACQGDDCDEGNPARHDGCAEDCAADPMDVGCPCEGDEPSPCFDADPELLGVGPCVPGLQRCDGGLWGACLGQRLPREEDPLGRNDIDDDCNGLVDDKLCGDGSDCGGDCCEGAEVCLGTSCVIPGDCAVDGNCDDDTRCTDGGCVPYTEGETNSACDGDIVDPIDPLEFFEPALQCEWTGGDEGDGLINVMTPGFVIELDQQLDGAPMHPEIVFSAFRGGGEATLIVIDGETCEERWRAEEAGLQIEAPMAAADIDGDGHVEIAAPSIGGGVVLYDDFGEILWRTEGNFGASWAPVLIADLDGRAPAEILRALTAFDDAGNVLWNESQGGGFGVGEVSVVADVDLDGQPEVVTGDRIFNGADGEEEQRFELGAGFPAIGDFDKSTPEPEIAVVSDSGTRIQTITGDVIYGPYDTVGGQRFTGGPPVVADFDNDGEVEFGAAGPSAYAVFDPDCEPGWERDGECSSGNDDGVLWWKRTQDISSGVTGSSVFDFDFDGVNEVVYNDECFTRVYDGMTGDTWWIRTNSTATGFEYPIIADADGDGQTEIVVTANDLIRSCPPDVDTGTEFEGPTFGVQVWRDVGDLWASSRRIWNQHAYSVTNVYENGAVPEVPENNWQVVGLNNFRVNTRDDPGSTERGVDMTVRGQPTDDALCPDSITLHALVANRGIRRAPRGISVAFYGIDPGSGAEVLVCEGRTVLEIEAGETELVSCDWLSPPFVRWQVHVVVDSTDALVECEEDNNDATIDEAFCQGVD